MLLTSRIWPHGYNNFDWSATNKSHEGTLALCKLIVSTREKIFTGANE